MQNIICFLDFDGVLHSIGQQAFNPHVMSRLADAIEHYPVSIVISSAWRLEYDLEKLRDFLGDRLGPRVIGVNPFIPDPFLKYCRFHEGQLYLEQADLIGLPWLAIDDQESCYPPGAPVVITDHREGFGPIDAEVLDQLLTKVV